MGPEALALLVITTWLWGSKYGPEYLARLRSSLERNIRQPYRFIVLTDNVTEPGQRPIPDLELTQTRGCFARLRMFDPKWQAEMEIGDGDRIVTVDLDSVITGELDPLFDRPEPFVIAQGGNYQPCRFNGALFMLRAGAHPEVWSDFSLDAAAKVPFHEFPDDQGWMWHKLPDAAGWECGVDSGVLVFKKPGWPEGDALPDGARYVTFAGWRDPGKFTHLDWVREHWR